MTAFLNNLIHLLPYVSGHWTVTDFNCSGPTFTHSLKKLIVYIFTPPEDSLLTELTAEPLLNSILLMFMQQLYRAHKYISGKKRDHSGEFMAMTNVTLPRNWSVVCAGKQ